MDSNKLAVLKSLPYEILPTCGLCAHADIRRGSDGFGTCFINTYEHMKHGEVRQMSIHRSGTCPRWERHEGKVHELERFAELLRAAQ